MAVQHVSAVLHGLFGVHPSVKLVMLVLAEHARRESGVAWPSMNTLARLSCLERRQVQVIVKSLVADGWLSLERANKGGRGQTNAYRINIGRLTEVRRQNDAARCTVSAVSNRAAEPTVSGTTNGAAEHAVRVVDEARQTMQSDPPNRAVDRRNDAAEGFETMQPAAPEPVLNRYITDFEPGGAHAAATSRERSTPPSRRQKIKPGPQKRTRGASGEMTEEEIAERKRMLREQVESLTKAMPAQL